jgi:hypothetical protein
MIRESSGIGTDGASSTGSDPRAGGYGESSTC